MNLFFFLHFPTNLNTCKLNTRADKQVWQTLYEGLKLTHMIFPSDIPEYFTLKCKLLRAKFKALLGKYQACKYNVLHCSSIKNPWMPSYVADSRNKRGGLERTTWPAFPPLLSQEMISSVGFLEHTDIAIMKMKLDTNEPWLVNTSMANYFCLGLSNIFFYSQIIVRKWFFKHLKF